MSKKQTLKKLLGYVGRKKPVLILNFILSIPAVVCMLLIPFYTGKAIDLLGGTFTTDELVEKAGMIVILAVIYCVLLWFINRFSGKIAYTAAESIRNDAMSKLQKVPLSYIDSHSHGSIINTLISDTEKVSEGLDMLFREFFTGIFTIVGTLVLMFTISPAVTAAVIVLTPLSLFAARFISKKTYSMFGDEAEARSAHAAFTEETVAGRDVVRAYSRSAKTLDEFRVLNDGLRKKSLKAVFLSSLVNPVTRFTNSLIYAAVALCGALLCIKSAGSAVPFTIGGLTCFLSYASQYAKPFNEISGVISELQDSLACASRVFAFISKESEKDDGTDSFDGAVTCGHVVFDKVCFSYDKTKKLVDDFSLDVAPGTKVAIVGKTGAGKTTLINLLMRFYETDSGNIFVDGKNIKDVPRRALRRRFGMVLQDTWLISGTVTENLSFGLTEASDLKVVDAAKRTHADDFIKKLPDKYNTFISEDDAVLSEGQKQLLCITRVLAADPQILILDEATSSVDALTETRIRDALDCLSKGRTVFTVAHRLATIKNADVILFIDNGNIAEAGSHEELLAKGGLYAAMYGSQFEGKCDE